MRDKALDKKKDMSLEDIIEKERTKLTGELTPLTKDLFEAWKEKWLNRMKADKDEELKQALATKKKDKKFLDPNFKFLSGRSMFVFNPQDELDEEGDSDADLQELIRNRKTVNVDDDEDEDGAEAERDGEKGDELEQDLIDNVELPDDDFGEYDLVNDCQIPDDVD